MKPRSDAARRELLRRRCQADYSIFVRRCWQMLPGNHTPPIWTRVMTVMCVVVEAVLRGRLGVVVMNTPPGCGKSTLSTRMSWPFAVLEQPYTSNVIGTHSLDDLGVPFNRDRLTLMRSNAYQALIPRMNGRPVWQLDPDQANRRRIGLVSRASGHPAGGWSGLASPERGGSGIRTGAHPNTHTYDDLIAAGEELGPSRAQANGWVKGTMPTRFPPTQGPRIIAPGQRLHEQDYSAALLDLYPTATHLVLPMEYDPDADRGVIDLGPPSKLLRRAFDGVSTLRRYRERHERAGIWLEKGRVCWADWRSTRGEPLMPELAGPEKYGRHKRNPVLWLTQYQQQPVTASMSHVQPQHWKRWRQTPQGRPDELLLVCDPQSGSQTGRAEQDYTTIYPLARWGSKAYILEEIRGRFDFGDTARLVFLTYRRWGLPAGMIEDAGCGPAVVSHLQGHVTGLRTVRPKGSTEMRVQWVSPMIHAGNVLVPADDAERPAILAPDEPWPMKTFHGDDRALPGALRGRAAPITTARSPDAWVPEFIAEWAAVPRGAYDDRCEVAHALLPWVGILGRENQAQATYSPPPSKPSRARQHGFGANLGRGRRRM